MRTTILNLRHLYQCRGFWWYYLVVAMFGSQMVLNKREPFGWLWFGMINLMCGIGIGMLQKEILSRPFTYCLPGYRPTPRRLVFTFGIVFNLLLSLLALFRKDLADYNAIGIVLSAFSFGLIVFLLVTLCTLISRTTDIFPFIVAGLLVILFLATSVLDNMTLSVLILLPTLATIALVAACLLLQGESLARKFCGRPVSGFSPPSKTARRNVEREKYVRQPEDPAPWIHEFFIRRIKSSGDAPTSRSVWSDLYLAFAVPLSHWKSAFFMLAVAVLTSGIVSFYIGSDGVNSPFLLAVAMVLCLAATTVRLPVYSNIPPFATRRQRFYGTISVAGATTLLMILSLFILTTATRLLELILPSAFAALPQMRFTFLPLAAVPAILILHILIRSQYIKSPLTVAIFFTCAVSLVRTEGVFILMLVASICAWTAFILVTRHACAKRCLIQ